MNGKKLLILSGAALLLMIGALALDSGRKPQSESDQVKEALVPGLAGKINDVDRIRVTAAENRVVATLVKGAKGWTVEEKGGYAADLTKVRELLLKLSEATLLEAKTANKDMHGKLGVEDVAAKDAKGALVELDGLGQPTRLLIGSQNMKGGDGTFVRRADSAQSWLAKGKINVPRTAAEWLRKDLLDIAAARLKSVAVVNPSGKKLTVAKAASTDSNFRVLDVPKGREASSEYVGNGLGAALTGLVFEDVLPAADAAPNDQAHKVRFATFDGLVVNALAWEADGKKYSRYSAELDAAQADAHIAEEQAKAKAENDAAEAAASAKTVSDAPTAAAGADGKEPASTPPVTAPAPGAETNAALPKPLAVSDPAKDREQKLAVLNQEVAAINERLANWTYILPDYNFSNMNKSLDDMLKPVETKK